MLSFFFLLFLYFFALLFVYTPRQGTCIYNREYMSKFVREVKQQYNTQNTTHDDIFSRIREQYWMNSFIIRIRRRSLRRRRWSGKKEERKICGVSSLSDSQPVTYHTIIIITIMCKEKLNKKKKEKKTLYWSRLVSRVSCKCVMRLDLHMRNSWLNTFIWALILYPFFYMYIV